MSTGTGGGGGLRAVEASDAAVLAALHARAFLPGERWDRHAIAAMLGMPGAFGWMAEGGFVLARAVAGEAEVLTIAVVPERRGAGLGWALLGAAVAEAGRRGATALFLEVSEKNAAARSLYARAGAEEVGRRRRYYADGADALVLRIAPDRGTVAGADPGGPRGP